MFGYTITPGAELAGTLGPALSPSPPSSPPPSSLPPASVSLPQRWMQASEFSARKPARDYAADIPIPQPDRVTRAVLAAIF